MIHSEVTPPETRLREFQREADCLHEAEAELLREMGQSRILDLPIIGRRHRLAEIRCELEIVYAAIRALETPT